MKSDIETAAEFIMNADVILIGAGAGIGCDSGLPNFRGDNGFWNNYPPYRGLFNFYDCANPDFLKRQPNLFWGFYGSRLEMYRKTQPHKGFNLLLDYEKKMNKKIFVLTSNVDGQFQKAGYPQDRIYEVHGSIHHLQCDKCQYIKENTFEPHVDYTKMSCQQLPRCGQCFNIVRPNILMFNDGDWINSRSEAQHKKYRDFWVETVKGKKQVCMIEIGAGTAITTIRDMLENNYYHNKKSKFIRINPDKDYFYGEPDRYVQIPLGCLDALTQIQAFLDK